MLLRSASVIDLPAVSEIEQTSFSAPWTTDTFRAGLYNFDTRFLVAEQNAALIGYVYAWLVVDEVQILRVAVHPDARRRGVAASILQELFVHVCLEDAKTASLEVRRDNHAACALYYKLGFSEIATRPRYYADGEDALLLAKDLTGETDS